MELTCHECDLLLFGLFELRITHLENDCRCAAIHALAARLRGDPSATFFGADAAAS
jgi:hypothetical protein